MQEWRVIEDGPQDGESNMAIDRAILASCSSGETLPTLRLYSWEQPTLTVGYAQDFAKEIDVNRCQKLGIQIVRRPTGGRALLHNHEVTYSFTAPIPHSKFPSSLLGAYKVVARALLEGLKEMVSAVRTWPWEESPIEAGIIFTLPHVYLVSII